VPRLPHFHFANVAAAVAVVAALGPPAAATAADLITGRDIADGSVTGKDIKNHSLGPKELGPLARALPTLGATGATITNYQDRAAMVRHGIPRGLWILHARFTVDNTGPNDDGFGCGFRVAGELLPSAGVSVAAGKRATGNAAQVVLVTKPRRAATLLCDTNNVTTLNMSRISMTLVRLG
jgi:hypothetical protein